MLNDKNTYDLITENPLVSLQKKVFNKINKLRNNCYLDENIKRKDLITINTNLARFYGLPKIHKDNFPLGPVVSTINSSIYFMSKYFTDILSKSLPKPFSYLKNSFTFKESILNLKIP